MAWGGGQRSNCLHLGERRNINKEPSFAFIAVICHLVRDNIKSLSGGPNSPHHRREVAAVFHWRRPVEGEGGACSLILKFLLLVAPS